jgi:anaerobic magnesium-protoporphyrin IX monomethyl ester cyclase
MKDKNRIRIVLADPPNSENNPYGIAFPNFGILYLIAYLRKNIKNIDIHYINASSPFNTQLERIKEISPDIYGLSLSSPFARIGCNVINEIKNRMPDLPVVCGGPHATVAPRDVLSNSKTDICCIGEGEETFLQIVKVLWNGGSLETIAGIAFRDSSGNIIISPKRALIPNLDAIPLPAWDIIRFSDYSGCRKAMAKPSAGIIASRGCPYNCTFCSNPVWRLGYPRLRLRSPDNIASEVKLLYNRGVREIYFRSDEMNPDIDWATSVFDSIARLELKDLHIQCNLRAKPMAKELAAAMQRAGCWLCHIGVESGSQRVLDGIRKGVTIAEIESTAKVLKEHSIKIYAFIMFYQAWEADNRLQTESTKEVIGTLKFVLKMRLKGLIDFMSCSFAAPFPGSDLDEIARRYNLKRPLRRPFEVITPQDITLRLPGIPLWEMALLRSLGLLTQAALFFLATESYRPSTLWQNVRHAIYKMKYLVGLKTKV